MLLSELSLDVDIDALARSVTLQIATLSDVPDLPKQGLLALRFEDVDGNDLEFEQAPSASGRVFSSERFGSFVYVDCGFQNPKPTIVPLLVPNGARKFSVRGHPWKGQGTVRVVGDPVVRLRREGEDSEFANAPGGAEPTGVPADEFLATYPVVGGVTYDIETRVAGPEGAQALFLPIFTDAVGRPLLPSGSFPISADHGEYFYARDHGADERTAVVMVPPRAATLRLRAIPWRGNGMTVAERPVVRAAVDEASRLTDPEVVEAIRGIPADAPVVVVYTTAGAIGAGSLLLRSNRLALEYAKAGWWVVFFPFSELKPDESERPAVRVLQFGRRRFRLVFDELVKRRGGHNVLVCSSNTDARMVGSIDRLHDAGWRVVYEVRDDMEEFNRVGYAKWFDPALELRVAKRADVLVAVSPRLAEKIGTITGREVTLVPNAAPDALVDATAGLRTLDAWARRTGKRKVGYIGHLTDSWFDWDLLLAAAQAVKVTVEIIGHGMPPHVSLPWNVEYLGPMTHDECLPFVQEWSAGLIPFKISPLTYGVDPNKIYEYVAMGLRTVTAPMGQVERIPGAWVYTDLASLVAGIRHSVEEPPTEGELCHFRDFAEGARWSRRAGQMIRLLEGRS